MKKKEAGTQNRIIRLIIALVVIACLGYGGYWFYSAHQGGSKAEETMKELEVFIPGLGVDTGSQTGAGRDPLASVTIQDMDIVGVIEIPAIDVMAPVTAKEYSEEFFASWLGGSPVSGRFMITGGRDDVFLKLAKLKPGDRVAFTDIDGVRYSYSVLTQYHLKKWDEGTDDLQLCYKTDDDTYFVVGCSADQ